MREAIIPTIFPAFYEYISGTKFQYSDLNCKDICGSIAHLRPIPVVSARENYSHGRQNVSAVIGKDSHRLVLALCL